MRISMISVDETSRENHSSKPHSREHYPACRSYSFMIPSWFLSSSRPHRTSSSRVIWRPVATLPTCFQTRLNADALDHRLQTRKANLHEDLQISNDSVLFLFPRGRKNSRVAALLRDARDIKLQSRTIVNHSGHSETYARDCVQSITGRFRVQRESRLL